MISGAEGLDVERQVCQLVVFGEPANLDYMNYGVEDEEEGFADSYLSAEVRVGIVDVLQDSGVSESDMSVGKDTGWRRTKVCAGKAIVQRKILLGTASHSEVALESAVEEEVGLDNCLDM